MTTFTVDVQAKRRGDLVDLTINRHQITLLYSEVDTSEKFAAWFLAQNLPAPVDEAGLRRRFVIEAHQDVDGVWIVDTATPQTLAQDVGTAGIADLPGWSTWDATQAEAWITANVTNLATAIVALKAMAKMLVYLRDRGAAL